MTQCNVTDKELNLVPCLLSSMDFIHDKCVTQHQDRMYNKIIFLYIFLFLSLPPSSPLSSPFLSFLLSQTQGLNLGPGIS